MITRNTLLATTTATLACAAVVTGLGVVWAGITLIVMGMIQVYGLWTVGRKDRA